MSNKLRYLIAFAILAVVGTGAWLALHRPAPLYNGKPLAYWLDRFELENIKTYPPHLDQLRFDEAVEGVREAGTNAIPTLLRMLRAKDSDLNLKLARLAQRQHFVNIHYYTADSRRWAARQGFLALLGPVAREAIPQLTDIHNEELSGELQNSYAGEILDLLKQMENARRTPTASPGP